MSTYYKYAERNADSQVNWAEIGKNMSDMLTETNRIREEKKDAIDKATSEQFKKIADSPIGQEATARQAALELANTASNQLKIKYDLLKQGLLDPKDYTIFHQNLGDNIDLAFNANKAYQDNYKQIMDRRKNHISSGLELSNATQAEKFGDWSKMGWIIAENGTIAAGLKTEKDIDGKKVYTLDDNPSEVASVSALNGLLLGRIDKYDYKPKIDQWTSGLGEEKTVITTLGTLQKQGTIKTREDITSRTDIDPKTKEELYNFIDAENQVIKEIAGNDLDQARILYDSKKRTNDNKPYSITQDADAAKKDDSLILKVYNPNTKGYDYQISDKQYKEIEDFLRNQMRSQYDYKESVDVVNQTQLQETEEAKQKAAAKYRVPEEVEQPTQVGEILSLNTTDADGKKSTIGVSQRIENLTFDEGKGIQNVATNISYNSKNGALELSGYQTTGKESEETSVKGEGSSGKLGSSVVNKKKFIKNDINSAPLLSTMIKKIPNPENPGYNFSNIKEAKSYYKRQYESRTGAKELD